MKDIHFLFMIIVTMQLIHDRVDSKEFMRCELAKTLINNDFQRTFLSNWVCMIEHESQRNTSKITEKPNRSSSYGLFQINSKQWCRPGRKGGNCNAKCEDENLSDDIACAKEIFHRDGFQHWQGWSRFCTEERNQPDLYILCKTS